MCNPGLLSVEELMNLGINSESLYLINPGFRGTTFRPQCGDSICLGRNKTEMT